MAARHRLPVVLPLLTLLAMAGVAAAASPKLNRLTPYGAQRGTEIDVVLAGARLADAQEILFYEPGVRVLSLEPQKENAVKVRLAVAPDCRLGQHPLRLRTASGLSELQLFTVGLLPEVQEAEPNSEMDKPQTIPLNVTVNGVVENEDVDYFVVEAKKGQRLAVEVEGVRLGQTFFDPSVAILDTNRFALAEADDTPFARQDAVAAAVVPADGKYLVQVRESAFGGNGNCRYRLHVGTFPRPLAAYPPGGRPGETIEVRWLGDAAGEFTEKISLPTGPQSTFDYAARDGQGQAPTPNVFRVVDLTNVLEAEPNDAAPQATSGPAPCAFNGILQKPGDVDYFKFPAKKGQAFDIRVHGRSLRSPVDSVLTVQRSKGGNVGSNDDSGTPDSYLRFNAPEDDDYIVVVRDHLNQGGPEYVYRVEVSPIAPQLTLLLPERERYNDVTAPVPAGNRMAVLVQAQREQFGGEVKLEIKDLPAGVSAEVQPIGESDTQVAVLLTAPADAKPAGSLVDLIGRWSDGNRTVEGRLRQHTLLVRGDNNREVCTYDTLRMAAAIAQSVPFSIEIVQPKAPLVQNGSMELKVVAQRQGKFKAPINLKMLYNPPGVSAPSVVNIPEGKTEAVIPLTANGNAAVRKSKIAVIGESNPGGGEVAVSTQLADLEVAAPLVKFTIAPAAVDQGQAAELIVKVEKNKDFDGAAKAEIVGLPNEVTSQPKEFNKDATELRFPLKSTDKSPVGLHKSLLCKAVITVEGEPVTHLQGPGELRIQKPVAAKPAEKPAEKPAPKPEKPAQPLSRLEQLRQQRENGK